MSRRIWLDVICDGCGLLITFEMVDTAAWVATNDPGGMPEKQGWSSIPLEGSNLRRQDFCSKCVEERQDRRKKRA